MNQTPTRYPLQWPAGWKRMDSWQRKNGLFKRHGKDISVFDGVQRVLEELKRLGIDENDVVISTNLRTRLDGLPRSDQAAPHDMGVAVYWQKSSKSPMRCMAVDAYDKVEHNLAAIAATLEAMRAIERHGGAAILDRAFTGFTALPAPIIAGNGRPWYVVLDCSPNSGREVIDHSYRRLASRYHPDKEGGDPAKMAELNAARDAALREIGA
jgi:hypothetical protein